MRHYATLFTASHLPYGLAMYTSLAKHSSEPFTLHILPMDEECRWTLEALELPHVEVVDRDEFMAEMGLKELRNNRTIAEFCWTCASNLTDWLMFSLDLDGLCYLDADLYFFSDPAPMFDEIGTRSIAITPHRLIPSKQYLECNGKFNVGVVYFRNTDIGRECLSDWSANCRAWCFNRVEPERFADQKYLDKWPAKYGDEVCELGIGVNVAPWNVGNWKLTEGPCVDGVPMVCYHMHEFADLGSQRYRLTYYDLRDEDKEFIYAPYILAFEAAKDLRYQALMKMESERA